MRFLSEATDELAGAALWYEGKAPGLGVRFLDAVAEAVALITERPLIGARWDAATLPTETAVRRYPLRAFPYLVIYTADPAYVVAIAHGHRRPGYWAQRLQNGQ